MKIGDVDHKMPETVSDGVPYVSPRDFYPNNVIDFDRAKRISHNDYLRLATKIKPDCGDLIYPRYGTIGENRLVMEQREFLASYSCAVIKTMKDFIDPKYQYIFSISGYCKDQAKAAENKTTQANVGIASIQQYIVPLPPLAEQHRMVAKVDELMALCDRLQAAQTEREQNRDRLVAASLHQLQNSNGFTPRHQDAKRDEKNLGPLAPWRESIFLQNLQHLTTRPAHIKQLRQTILNLAVRGKLVPQDPSDEPAAELLKRVSKITEKSCFLENELDNYVPFELAQGWVWSQLGLITTKTGSGSTPRGGKSVYQAIGVPFLRSQNIYNDGLRLNDVAYIDDMTHTRMYGTAVESGDLLLNITGGSIGRCCRIPESPIKANISQHVAIIRLADPGMRDFSHIVVQSPFFQSFVIDEQTGAGRGGLPKNRMDRIPVPVPPLAEQHRIVAKVGELMALCDQLETQLTITQADSRRLLEAVLHEALAPTPKEAIRPAVSREPNLAK
jgi:type I restriction enzyme S subunit